MSVLTNLFSEIAEAIRAKTGNTEQVQASNFPSAIGAIPSGAVYVEFSITGDKHTFTIDAAKGKDNIIIVNGTNNGNIATYATAAKSVNGWSYVMYYNGASLIAQDTGVSWDKTTGVFETSRSFRNASIWCVAW